MGLSLGGVSVHLCVDACGSEGLHDHRRPRVCTCMCMWLVWCLCLSLPPSPSPGLSEELIRRLLAMQVTSQSPVPACLVLQRMAAMGPALLKLPILEAVWPGAPPGRRSPGPSSGASRLLIGVTGRLRQPELGDGFLLGADCPSQLTGRISMPQNLAWGVVGSTDPLGAKIDPGLLEQVGWSIPTFVGGAALVPDATSSAQSH